VPSSTSLWTHTEHPLKVGVCTIGIGTCRVAQKAAVRCCAAMILSICWTTSRNRTQNTLSAAQTSWGRVWSFDIAVNWPRLRRDCPIHNSNQASAKLGKPPPETSRHHQHPVYSSHGISNRLTARPRSSRYRVPVDSSNSSSLIAQSGRRGPGAK
jgi:hypothetical protein